MVDSSLQQEILQIEAVAFNNLGIVAANEGTEEDAKTALEYLEKYWDICMADGFSKGVKSPQSNNSFEKSKYEGSRSQVREMEMLEKIETCTSSVLKKEGKSRPLQ